MATNWFDEPVYETPSPQAALPAATVTPDATITPSDTSQREFISSLEAIANSNTLQDAIPNYSGAPSVARGLQQYAPKTESVDEVYARIAQQKAAAPPKPAAGLWQTVKDVAGAIPETIRGIPAVVASSIEGTENPYQTRDWKDTIIESERARQRKQIEDMKASGEYDQPMTGLPMTRGEFAETVQSFPYTAATMLPAIAGNIGGTVLGGLAGGAIGGPGGAVAGGRLLGGLAGGAAGAYLPAGLSAANQFIRDGLEKFQTDFKAKQNREATPQEIDKFYRDTLLPEAPRILHGESAPEAAGTAVEIGLMKSAIGDVLHSGGSIPARLAKAGAKLALSAFAIEPGTETLTQQIQQPAYSRAGLTDEAPRSLTSGEDWIKSGGEVYKQAAVTSIFFSLLGMGGGAAHKTFVKNPNDAKAVAALVDNPDVLQALPSETLDNLQKVTENLNKAWIRRNPKLGAAIESINAEQSSRLNEPEDVTALRDELLGLAANQLPENSLARQAISELRGKSEHNGLPKWARWLDTEPQSIRGEVDKNGLPTGNIDVQGLQGVQPSLEMAGQGFKELKELKSLLPSPAGTAPAGVPPTGTPPVGVPPVAGTPPAANPPTVGQNTPPPRSTPIDVGGESVDAVTPGAEAILNAQQQQAANAGIPVPKAQDETAPNLNPTPNPITLAIQSNILGLKDSDFVSKFGGMTQEEFNAQSPEAQGAIRARIAALPENLRPDNHPALVPTAPTPPVTPTSPEDPTNAQTVRSNQGQTGQGSQEGQPGVQSSPEPVGSDIRQPGSDQKGTQPAGEVAAGEVVPAGESKASDVVGGLTGGEISPTTTKSTQPESTNAQPSQEGQGQGQTEAEALLNSNESPPVKAGVDSTLAPTAPNEVSPKTAQKVSTPDNKMAVDTGMEVVELSDLITSDDARFPGELQPRDRNRRQSSETAISDIARNLNPDRLLSSPVSSDGAPIVGADGLVESGNGRVMALRKAYAQFKDKADAYRAKLGEQGFDTTGMSEPVLIRRRMTPLDEQQRIEFTQKSNMATVASMSPAERANLHAKRLLANPSALEAYRGGDPGLSVNAEFVGKFFQDIFDPSERGQYQTKDGMLSQDGRKEIQSAIMAAAYPDTTLLETLIESSDNNIKTIGSALREVAPDILQAKAHLRKYPELKGLDLSGPLTEAARLINQARAENKGIKDILDQQGMFESIDPTVERLVRLFFADADLRKGLSQPKLVKILQTYAQDARIVQPSDPLFSDIPNIVVGDLLSMMEKRREAELPAEQAPLFGSNPSSKGSTEGGQGNKRPSSNRTGETDGTSRPGKNNPEVTGTKAEKEAKTRELLVKKFLDGERFNNIIEARSFIYGSLGLEQDQENKEYRKVAEELIEQAIVKTARSIVQNAKDPKSAFLRLVELYKQQPNLATRTNESVTDQAYSTPIPLAYLVSHLAGIGLNSEATIVEPTAGNGALLIAANPAQVEANEKNRKRADYLKQQGFNTTQSDATTWTPANKADILVANPPFGKVAKNGENQSWVVPSQIAPDGNYKTSEVDHAIALQQLNNLKDDGTAILLLGGVDARTEAEKKNKYSAKTKSEFFWTLVNDYNVVDMFTIGGNLYGRQGAKYPVDVVIIHGRRTAEVAKTTATYPLPAASLPRVYESWDQLSEVISNEQNNPEWNPVVSGRDNRGGPVANQSDTEGRGTGTEGNATGSAESGGNLDTGRGQKQDGAGTGGKTVLPGPATRGEVPTTEGIEGEAERGRRPISTDSSVGVAAEPAPVNEDKQAPDDGLDTMFDELLSEEIAANKALEPDVAPPLAEPSSAPINGKTSTPGPTPRTAGQAASSAASNAAKGLGSALDGLNALFGTKGRLSSGLTFDEETYAKAKPFFQDAIAHFKEATTDAREAMRLLIRALLDKFGDPGLVKNMQPYVTRFIRDISENVPSKEDIQPPKVDTPSQGQAKYSPASKHEAIGTLVPINMQLAAQKAITNLEQRVGPVDEYVAKELGYAVKDLGKYFKAEQIDSLALAIDNISQGRGYVTADQTGVGKGRVNAGIMLWAIRNGKTPIFVTERENLYTDMLRDMRDIGMGTGTGDTEQIQSLLDRILITNSDSGIPLDDAALAWYDEAEKAKVDGTPIPKKYGEFLKTPTLEKQKSILSKAISEARLPGKKQIIFTTYSQLNPLKGQRSIRHDFIDAFANNGIVLLDESHNAGGSGKVTPGKFVRSGYFRKLVDLVDGAFYSSATFAKRPDVMDLYRRTDMRLAVDNIDDLGETISNGGIPLQQVVSSTLVEAGQLLRRERSFAGVQYETPTVQINQQVAENISSAMRSILVFSQNMKDVVKDMSSELAATAGGLGAQAGADLGSVGSTSFSSIMHNLISQFLLGLKARAAVNQAITALKNGEKPILTVANTLESLLAEYKDEAGINIGDPIDMSFGNLLERYLEKSRMVRERKPFQKSAEPARRAEDNELTPQALRAYNDAINEIRSHDWSDIPASPIDFMKSELAKAGYSVGEITGRQFVVDYQGSTPTLQVRSESERGVSGRIRAIRKFNDGNVDVLILNQAGATGLSLHASPKVGKDLRRRHMIIAQAEANIDTHMQMLGRIHRTGQVIEPRYSQLVGNIPAEIRPAAVLAKKMASLNANTTSARSSAVTSKDTLDFMNAYGDEAVAAVMFANQDLHRRLGEPLALNDDGDGFKTEGAARKVTGYLPMLPLKAQERLYRDIEDEYKSILETAIMMGENKLEAQTLETDAKKLRSTQVFDGVPGNDSPFAGPAHAVVYDIKRQGRVMTQDEIRQELAKFAGVPDAMVGGALRKKTESIIEDLQRDITKFIDSEAKQISEAQLLSLETRVRAMADKITTVLRDLMPGSSVSAVSANGNVFYGTVIGIERMGNPKNPAVNSAWRIRIAVADSLRVLTLPLTRMEVGGPENAQSGRIAVEPYDPVLVQNSFDNQEGLSREERIFLEGNLLAAYSQFPNGQIVYFRKEDGELQQGILMPRSFDLKKAMDEKAKIFQTSTEAAAFLAEKSRSKYLSAQNGDVILRYLPRADRFEMVVPKSKAQGGLWFQDDRLIALSDSGFISMGKVFNADFKPSTLQSVLDAIYNQIGHRMKGIDLADTSGQQNQDNQRRYSRALSPIAREAIAKFGVTDNLAEAGYVLPDGTLLDLSGRSQAADYQRIGDRWRWTGKGRDYLANQRSLDHRDVSLLPSITKSETDAMLEFQRNTKALRIDLLSGRVSTNFSDWTPAQMRAVMAIARENDGSLTLDFDHPVTGRLLRSVELDKATPAKINALLQEETTKEPLFSRADDTTTEVNLSQAAARQEAVEALGETLVAGLEKAGILVWLDKDNLPPAIKRIPPLVQAMVSDGVTYLVPSNMRGGSLRALLHESAHLAKDERFTESDRAIVRLAHTTLSLVGLRNFIGNPGFQDLAEQVQRMAREGNQVAIDAINQATKVDPNNVAEESVAYLAEYVNPNLPIVRRIMTAIRAALYRMGIKIQLRPEDVRQLALSALKVRAKRTLREQKAKARLAELEKMYVAKYGDVALAQQRVDVLQHINEDTTLAEFRQQVTKLLEQRYSLSSNSPGVEVGEATLADFEAVRAQFKAKQAETPFTKWFGKGVPGVTAQADGTPITLYHGTNNPLFNEWDSSRTGETTGHPTSGLGFFMTSDPYSAARYGSTLLELNAKIDHPYFLTDADLVSIENRQDAERFRWNLMKKGYDGAVVRAPGGAPYVIAFRSNQIKFTTNESPTAGPDFRYSRSPRIRRTVAELIDGVESMAAWSDWYDRHETVINDIFGEDAKLFQSILSATSQAATVKSNVALAIKAYNQLKTGQDFTGYLPAVIKNLERIKEDKSLAGAKISEYGKANENDLGAIPVDRHIASLFFNTTRPNAEQIRAAKIRIVNIAKQLNMQPRNVQAALWALNQTLQGVNPNDIQSYDALLSEKADKIAALRAAFPGGEGTGVPGRLETVQSNQGATESSQEELKDSQGNPVRYSRANPNPPTPEDGLRLIDEIGAVDTANTQKGVLKRLLANPEAWKQTLKTSVGDATSNTRPAWLRLLSRQQLVEMLEETPIRNLSKLFEDTARLLDADKQAGKQAAFGLADRVQQAAAKSRDKGRSLYRLWFYTTLESVDPTKPARSRSEFSDNADYLRSSQAHAKAVQMLDDLKATNPEMAKLYKEVLDEIKNSFEAYHQALRDRLGRGANGILNALMERAKDVRPSVLQQVSAAKTGNPALYSSVVQAIRQRISNPNITIAEADTLRNSLPDAEQKALYDDWLDTINTAYGDILANLGHGPIGVLDNLDQKAVDSPAPNSMPARPTLVERLSIAYNADSAGYREIIDAVRQRIADKQQQGRLRGSLKTDLQRELFDRLNNYIDHKMEGIEKRVADGRVGVLEGMVDKASKAPTGQQTLTQRMAVLNAQNTADYDAFIDTVRKRLTNPSMESSEAQAIRDTLPNDEQKVLFDDIVADVRGKIKNSMDSLQAVYEQAKVLEPYFPLSRWGQFQVYAEKEGEPKPIFGAFEKQEDQRTMIAQLKKDGWTVKVDYEIKEALTSNKPADSFIGKMFVMVDEMVSNKKEQDALKDEFYQLYLKSLPELSARKHFLHRKGIPGFSVDALRGFAQLANSRANSIARLKYSDTLTESLVDMERALRRLGADPSRFEEINRAAMIVQELQGSYEWMMNPTNATWANRLTSFGFLWHLTNFSTALVNLTQVPIVSFPDLAAKFSPGSAFSALNKAIKDYGGWKLSGTKAAKEKAKLRLESELDGDLWRALHSPKIASQISRTEAVTLAGMSDDAPEYRGGARGAMASLYRNVLYYGGWLYNKAEVANREVTVIAAYRLAREKAAAEGKTREQAHDYATEMAYNSMTRTQGDFSLGNRPYFMRSNMMRVMFLFRSFSHFMTWNIARDLYQSFKGSKEKVGLDQGGTNKSPRELARQRLAFTGLTSLVFGGATGFPAYSVISSIANALFGSDPDDPWDFDDAVRSELAAYGGDTFMRTVMGGPVGQAPRILNLVGMDVKGIDLAPRVSLDLARLWVRRQPEDSEGGNAMDWWLGQIAGPLYGTARGVAEGLRMLGQTSYDPQAWMRTLEGVTPAPIRNMAKSYRFHEYGVTTRKGDLLMDHVGFSDLISQVIGFTPDELADQYQRNTRAWDIKYALEKQRRNILSMYVFSAERDDKEMMQAAIDRVSRFNQLNPEYPITLSSLSSSYRKFMLARAEQEHGVYVPSKGLRARIFRDLKENNGEG